MVAPTSFRKGLFYASTTSDPVPAIVVQTFTTTTTTANLAIGSVIVFEADGSINVRAASLLTSSSPLASDRVNYFIEEP